MPLLVVLARRSAASSATSPSRAVVSQDARALRIELGVPIKIIQPAIMQIVRRKQPPVAVQLVHRRRERMLSRKRPGLLRRQIALAQIAWRACGDHVFPGGLAALAA